MNPQKRAERARAKKRYNVLARHFGISSSTGNAIKVGNPDFGCPYKGKDRFGGMNRKFSERVTDLTDDNGEVTRFCVQLDNNKYRV